jgi:hypothetical protein
MAIACQLYRKPPPQNSHSWVKAFLQRNHFVTRSVTHSASALNPKHETLIRDFKRRVKELVLVCLVLHYHLCTHCTVKTTDTMLVHLAMGYSGLSDHQCGRDGHSNDSKTLSNSCSPWILPSPWSSQEGNGTDHKGHCYHC